MHIRYKPHVAALAVGGLLAWAAAAPAQMGYYPSAPGYYPPVFVPTNPQPGWSYPVVMPPAMPTYYPAQPAWSVQQVPAQQVPAQQVMPAKPDKQDKQSHRLVSWPFHKKHHAPACPEVEHPAPAPKEKEPAKLPDKEAPKLDPPVAEPAFAPEQAAAGGAEGFALDSGVGYIDSAPIRTIFRLRMDAAYGANRPDRAEFFYPKCGCFRITGADPNAKGPPPGAFGTAAAVPADFDIDYQEVSAYFEYAFSPRFSGFIEVPFRFVNFSVFPQQEGIGDINVGVKAALLVSDDSVLTFQFRTYTSTGMGDRGLGTQHISLEPALLFFSRLSDRLVAEGEFRYWIPLNRYDIGNDPNVEDFKGDVIRYGIGLSYNLGNRSGLRVAPVAEIVGWTVLDGFELDPDLGGGLGGVEDADGDTIINGKFGVRIGKGKSDMYIGYGRALTGEVWYKDIIRFEFRRAF